LFSYSSLCSAETSKEFLVTLSLISFFLIPGDLLLQEIGSFHQLRHNMYDSFLE